MRNDMRVLTRYRLGLLGMTRESYNMRGYLDNSWRAEARCLGESTEMFVPPYQMAADPRAKIRLRKFVENAAAICETCPVKEECLKYGRDTRSFGVFGGVLLKPKRPL